MHTITTVEMYAYHVMLDDGTCSVEGFFPYQPIIQTAKGGRELDKIFGAA